MSGWERFYALITDDIQLSSVIAVSLLVIGYVCAKTSRNCIYAFHIGKNRDAAAGRFAVTALALYITSGLMLTVMGYHSYSQNQMMVREVPVTNTVTASMFNPIVKWFDDVYSEFKEEITLYENEAEWR